MTATAIRCFDQNGQLIPVDDDDPFTGTNNTSTTRTRGWGGSVQLSAAQQAAGTRQPVHRRRQFRSRRLEVQALTTEIARLTETAAPRAPA